MSCDGYAVLMPNAVSTTVSFCVPRACIIERDGQPWNLCDFVKDPKRDAVG